MEAIIKSIQEKIGKLVVEENTDFNKLKMLVKFLEDIKTATLTSVDQVHEVAGNAFGVGVNQPLGLPYQMQGVPPRNAIDMMADEMREAIHSFKKKDGRPAVVPTSMYISWYDFLEKLSATSSGQAATGDRVKSRLLDMIIKSIEMEIDNMDNKNKNKDASSGQDSTGIAPASTEITPPTEGGATQ